MEPLDVAVVIPTYDRPELLREALDSVLAQTRPPREILVVDNGTDEATAALLRDYADRVTAIRMEPAGVQAARNRGAAAAATTWVAFLDDDDLYRPTFLERLAPALEDGRADLVFGDHRKFLRSPADRLVNPQTNLERTPAGYWDGLPRPLEARDAEGGPGWCYVGSFPVERLLRFTVFYPSTMVVRKSFYEQIGGFDPALRGYRVEDLEFMSRALPVGRVAIAPAALVDYRVHPSNTSGDPLVQLVERWRVFELVRERDRHGSATLRAALEANLPGRRRAILGHAFRSGNVDLVREVATYLRSSDWTTKTRLQYAAARLPRPLAGLVLRAVGPLLPGRRYDRRLVHHWVPAPG